MQNYLLPFCEKLVLTELRQNRAQTPLPDQMYFIRTLASLQAEKELAIEGFNRLAFEIRNEGETKWMVRAYQEKIVFLSDQIAAGMTNEDILATGGEDDQEPAWANLSKAVLRMLLELLNLVEHNFAKFIELDGRIPVAYLVVARHKFDKRLAILTTALAAAGVSDELQEFIRQPFREFLCEDDGRIITYQRLFYLNMLMYELSSVMPLMTQEGNIDTKIQEKLRELNYNHPDFYAYCTACIEDEVDALPPKERLEHLIWILKEVNQIQHKHGMTYNPLSDSLKQQLQMWLTEEINYLKAVSDLPTSAEVAASTRWKGFKVETQFSVPQMGYYIKLLCDTGFFTNPNKSELLDFFSEFFATIKQPKISSGSLRKNFYNDNASAAAGVRDILLTLLNHSKRGLSTWVTVFVSFCEIIFHLLYVNQ